MPVREGSLAFQSWSNKYNLKWIVLTARERKRPEYKIKAVYNIQQWLKGVKLNTNAHEMR